MDMNREDRAERRLVGRPIIDRRCLLRAFPLLLAVPLASAADRETALERDPFGSLQWPELRREFFGTQPVEFDPRVRVVGPAFAEDPMNVPVTVSARGLEHVEAIVVLVDRNPIRRVLEYVPVTAMPDVSFRFKLEQASPVRAAARTRDGIWHVGGTWIDSTGGGCTAPGAARQSADWAKTLGTVSARVFPSSTAPDAGGSRVRLRVMHPMDTGLVAGVPAFYLQRLSLQDARGRELLRLLPFEPISENPVFTFDLPQGASGPLRLLGTDNNGNRIDARIESGGDRRAP
jgi:sulfur-oxidizing protein SoxY